MTSKTRNKCVRCTVHRPFGYQAILLLFLVASLARCISNLRTVCNCASVDTIPVLFGKMFCENVLAKRPQE